MTASLLERAKAGDGEARMELARIASRAGKRAEAEHWIAEAAATGQQTALFQTAVWKLIGYRGPQDFAAGEAGLRSAAEAGEAQAISLLSTLAVSGPVRDWGAAKRLLLQAAEAHDPRALLQLALMLPPDRKWQETRLALADRAAGKGYATALYFAGRFLIDQGGQDSQALARLTLAARSKEPNALKFLRSRRAPAADPSSPVFELASINWARLAEAIQWPHERALPQPMIRQSAPKFVSFNRLLTAEECDYVISRGAPYLQTVQPPNAAISDAMVSSAAGFGLIESDALLQSFDERLGRIVGATDPHVDTLTLLHYAPGQRFSPVGDWIDPAAPAAAAEIAARGQRATSVIVHLCDGYEGGETLFPRIGWRFKGKRGDALTWRNVDQTGTPDLRTLHQTAVLGSSDKFVVLKSVRETATP